MAIFKIVPAETTPVKGSTWLRLLDFIEQPLFLWSAATVAGLVAYFVYPYVLLVCGVCVLLAFHRARVVKGEKAWVQVASYLMLFVVTTSGLFGVGHLIKKRVPQLATLSDIRELLELMMGRPSPQARDVQHSAPTPAAPKPRVTVPMPPKIQVTFTSSRVFEAKPSRKTRIASEINRMYEYLQTVGFNPTTAVPPVGTIALKPRPTNACGGVIRHTCPGTIEEQSIQIIDPDIDRPQCIRKLYSMYAFGTLFGTTCSSESWIENTSDIFATYFSASFDGKPVPPHRDWNDALWEVRNKYGKHVVDTALLFMFNEGEKSGVGASWQRTSGDRTFNDFFSNRFRYALFLSDSDFRKDILGILTILEQHKLIESSH